jgi:hypothetical protein
MSLEKINERLDRFKLKHAELKTIIETLSDSDTDEPRWSYNEALIEIEKNIDEAIRQGIRGVYDLKQIAKNSA